MVSNPGEGQAFRLLRGQNGALEIGCEQGKPDSGRGWMKDRWQVSLAPMTSEPLCRRIGVLYLLCRDLLIKQPTQSAGPDRGEHPHGNSYLEITKWQVPNLIALSSQFGRQCCH